MSLSPPSYSSLNGRGFSYSTNQEYWDAVADRLRQWTTGDLDGISKIKNRPTMAEFQAAEEYRRKNPYYTEFAKKETALPMFIPDKAVAPGGYRAILTAPASSLDVRGPRIAWESTEVYEDGYDAVVAAGEALKKIEAAAITAAGLKAPAPKVVPRKEVKK